MTSLDETSAPWQLNDLLLRVGIDPKTVIVLRHRPTEKELAKKLPQLAHEFPEQFNAYQRTQGPKLEAAMLKSSFVASFIGMKAGSAVFVGLYRIAGGDHKMLSELRVLPEFEALLRHGMAGWDVLGVREKLICFDLELQSLYSEWKGRLEVHWPSPEISWWRKAEKNVFAIKNIHPNTQFLLPMPSWDELVLNYNDLKMLPEHWLKTLQGWRGIYLIKDSSDGRFYVGSAYGDDNLHGRWMNYVNTGHGGNKHLKGRAPAGFTFSILEILPHNASKDDVIKIERSWKNRLNTEWPLGLNGN